MEPESGRQVACLSGDADLVRRALARDGPAFRSIMERNNRRLYRIGILGNDSEAEDAVQDAYVNAFAHLDSFRGDSSLATWLARIAMNEALGRLRRERPTVNLEAVAMQQAGANIIQFPYTNTSSDPERTMAQREFLRLAERAADSLPGMFRIVFVMRVIEGMSVGETAGLLGLQPKTVRTRLHSARRLIGQANWPGAASCVSLRWRAVRTHDRYCHAAARTSWLNYGTFSG